MVSPFLIKFLKFGVETDFSPKDFLALDVEGLSFLAFFSGTTLGGEARVPASLIAPITATVDGSTKVLSLLGVDSNFLASRYSFFSL